MYKREKEKEKRKWNNGNNKKQTLGTHSAQATRTSSSGSVGNVEREGKIYSINIFASLIFSQQKINISCHEIFSSRKSCSTRTIQECSVH